MASAASPTSALPSRTGTQMTKGSTGSDDEAFGAEDTSEVTKLFGERLQAWKHACGYLEDYVTATEKVHAQHAKEYEKVLKSVTKPLKEGHHFDQNLGGMAGFFDNLRSNTQGISNSHHETAKTLKGSVLPIFERLHTEIKAKSKELLKGAGKGAKSVDKARSATQKHIELLGQHTASFDSTGGKVSGHDDPYVLQRGVRHRLNKQLIEENANRQDLLAVQSNFASFEASIIKTIQNGLGQFNTIITKQADITKSLYGDVVGTAQRIPPDFEWNGFLNRNQGVLIDPTAEARQFDHISFPNQTHRATIPLISGSLDLRGKILRKYDTGYWVVTPSKFLHQFKTDDDFAKEPLPEVSLFLPDCLLGAVVGDKFTVKGKDVSKGKLGVGLHTSHDYNFKAHTPDDAERWGEIIKMAAGQVTNEAPPESVPTSPVSASTAEGEKFGTLANTTPQQETGTTQPVVAAAPVHSEKAIEAGHAPAPTSTTAATDHAAPPVTTTTNTAAPGGPVTTSAGPGQNATTAPAKS